MFEYQRPDGKVIAVEEGLQWDEFKLMALDSCPLGHEPTIVRAPQRRLFRCCEAVLGAQMLQVPPPASKPGVKKDISVEERARQRRERGRDACMHFQQTNWILKVRVGLAFLALAVLALSLVRMPL